MEWWSVEKNRHYLDTNSVCGAVDTYIRKSVISAHILGGQFFQLLDVGVPRSQQGRHNGPSSLGELVTVTAWYFLEDLVRAQQRQESADAGCLLPLLFAAGAPRIEQCPQIAVAQAIQSKFTPIDRFQELSVLDRPGIEPSPATAFGTHRATQALNQLIQRLGFFHGSQSVQIAGVGGARDFSPPRQIGQASPQRAPSLGRFGLSFRTAIDLKIFTLIDGRLDSQAAAKLVVHLQAVTANPMFNPQAFGPTLQIAQDFSRKARLPAQRHIASQKAQHVATAKAQQRMLGQPGIKRCQPRGFLEHDIGRKLALATTPIILPIQRAADLAVQGVALIQQMLQGFGPLNSGLPIHQRLSSRQVLYPGQVIVLTFIGDAGTVQLTAQPLPAVEANFDLERKPGLQPQVHEAPLRVLLIKVKMNAFGCLEERLGAMHLISLARLNATQDGNQTAFNLIVAGDLAGQLFLGSPGRAQVEPWPLGGKSHLLGVVNNASGQVQRIRLEPFEEHLANIQIPQQNIGLIETAQGAAQTQTVKTRKNPDDRRLVTCYKGMRDVVRCVAFHTPPQCGKRPSNVTLFGSGYAGLRTPRPTSI